MNLLESYIIAFTNLYGMISNTKLKEIIKHYGDRLDGQVYDQDVLIDHSVYKYNGFYVKYDFLDNHAFNDHFKMIKGKGYYLPEKEILFSYLDENYIESSEALVNLQDFLNKNQDQAEGSVESVSRVITKGLLLKDDFSYIIEESMDHGLDLESFKREQTFIGLLMDLQVNLRLWEYNGYAYKELREIYSEYRDLTIIDDYTNKVHLVYDKIKTLMGDYKGALTLETIDYVLNDYLEFVNMIDPADLMISLLSLMHEFDDVEDMIMIDLYKKLLNFSKDNQVIDKHKAYLSSLVFNQNKNVFTVTIYKRIESLLKSYGYKGFQQLHKHSLKMVFNKIKQTKVNPELDSIVNRFLKALNSITLDKRTYLYNLLLVYPLSYIGLSGFLYESQSAEDDILITKAIILAFEKVHDLKLFQADKDFSKNANNHYYLDALVIQGSAYKLTNQNALAIESYTKLLVYSTEDSIRIKESLLKAYYGHKDFDLFRETIKELPENSVFKHYATIVLKNMDDEDFHDSFKKAFELRPLLMEKIMTNKGDYSSFPWHHQMLMDDYISVFRNDMLLFKQMKELYIKYKGQYLPV